MCVYLRKKTNGLNSMSTRRRRERHGISVFFPCPPVRLVSRSLNPATSLAIGDGGSGANKRGRVPGIYLTAAVAFAVDISSRHELQFYIHVFGNGPVEKVSGSVAAAVATPPRCTRGMHLGDDVQLLIGARTTPSPARRLGVALHDDVG